MKSAEQIVMEELRRRGGPNVPLSISITRVHKPFFDGEASPYTEQEVAESALEMIDEIDKGNFTELGLLGDSKRSPV